MPDARCPNCGHQVPEGEWCVRCGAALTGPGGGRRGGSYVAAPHERAISPRVVSTLFPQLPRSDTDAFRVLLAAGILVVVGLAAGRLFGVAAISAALLVPLLTVVYLYDVDVYEDQPLRVTLFTLAWGAVAGVGVALLTDAVTDTGAVALAEGRGHDLLAQGVLIPLLGVVLMLAGPLVLLPYRRFNDVLDGATFGAVTAAAFVGAAAVTLSWSLFDAGLRPDGEVVPWLARILTLAVGLPILAMAAVGAATAALWLRYRAPVRERGALGPLGHPAVAVPLAALLYVLGELGQPLLPIGAWLAELVVLDLIALLWLRRSVHIGLLEEAAEIEIGPPIQCPNCGARTASHTFCGNCGIALRALPKQRRPEPPAAGSPAEAGA